MEDGGVTLDSLFQAFELDPVYSETGTVSFRGLSDNYPAVPELLDAIAPFVADHCFIVWIGDEQEVEINYFLGGRWASLNVDWPSLLTCSISMLAEQQVLTHGRP